jgi:hypothetical protein
VSALLAAARASEALGKGKPRAERERIARDLMLILLTTEARR